MTDTSNRFGNPFSPMHGMWYLLLFVVAAVLAGYIGTQVMRKRRYERFANTELLDKIAPKRPKLVRYVPAAVLLAGLLFLTVALAGPTAVSQVAKNQATVILVLDISKSMAATDVKPSRVDAARAAAIKFVDGMAPTVQLGVVTFAGNAQPLVRPSTDHETAKKVIDQMIRPDKLEKQTATGEGIYTALQQIETIAGALGGKNHAPPARIVLVSDGKETVPDDLNAPRGAYAAARTAKEKHIPVCTIAFGTKSGKITIDNQVDEVPVDLESLKKISDLSNSPGNSCRFFPAESQADLAQIYQSLNEDIGYEHVRSESSRIWALCGTLLVAGAAGASFFFNRALP
ncbi:MAG: VWA domain-containing protein [Segniliparus sp.]|uniref:VWA domain-containing protein n=1 Tax=Segniliparus sp. TaxID=2804064 RepID=UPI003F30BAF1